MPYTVANSLDDAARRIREFLTDALPEITSFAAADIVAVRDSLTIVLGHVERIRRELSRPDADRRCAWSRRRKRDDDIPDLLCS